MRGRGPLALCLLLNAGPALAALPQGYLVWSRGTADDPATRKIHRLTLPEKSDERDLTAGEDVEPQVSPDGKWVAYAKAKFPGGSDYHDPKLWKLYLVSIHGAGEGRREIKVDDDGAWPSWSKSGALFYNQADGSHSLLVRVELDERGQVTRKQTFATTRELFGGFGEVNEAAIAPDESWFVARTRGNTVQNGVSAFTVAPPSAVLLARAGEIGCIPRMAPSGTFALIAGATEGIRWGHGPQVPGRKQDQLLIPPHTPQHKAYHPGISTDERWVLDSQGIDPDHNAGRYDLSIYALDPATMTISDQQALTAADFNGWPHLWVGAPSPPPPPRPEVADFFPSSYTVAPAEMVTLTWSTFGADQVTLDAAPVPPEGMMNLAPAGTATYTLRAASSVVPATDGRTVTVTVNATPQPVGIELFAADPPRIEKGHSAVLRWVVRNPTTVDLDTRRALPNESREVSPLETTTYVLTARGYQGPVEARVTVVVEAQKSGLLPDRGGFRCGINPGNRASGPGWGLLLAAAALMAARRSRSRRSCTAVCWRP
jgi:hypothetical protein